MSLSLPTALALLVTAFLLGWILASREWRRDVDRVCGDLRRLARRGPVLETRIEGQADVLCAAAPREAPEDIEADTATPRPWTEIGAGVLAAPKIEDVPHEVGDAQCRVCKHEWIAVIPASRGLHDMECPNCGRMAGEAKEEPEF